MSNIFNRINTDKRQTILNPQVKYLMLLVLEGTLRSRPTDWLRHDVVFYQSNHAQVPEPIGFLCMIVGLAPRVLRRSLSCKIRTKSEQMIKLPEQNKGNSVVNKVKFPQGNKAPFLLLSLTVGMIYAIVFHILFIFNFGNTPLLCISYHGVVISSSICISSRIG